MDPFKLLKALFASAPRLRVAECAERIKRGDALLVDVREPREWKEGVAREAVLLPLSDLIGSRRQWSAFLADVKNRELLFYCGAGVRSAIAARILLAEGFRASNAGSLSEWAAAGWPIVTPL